MPLVRRIALCLALLTGLAAASPALAVGLLRDAEIEHGLDILARPLLTAAGLPASRTQVIVVNDMAMNAFVVNSRVVFVNAGLILRLQSAAELQAVIAHEIGHIANGHVARRGLNAQAARNATLLGLAAGVAAGAVSGHPGAGAGIAMGAHSSAMRVFFGHTRQEEAAADNSGIAFLARSGIDPQAFRRVLSLFEGQEALLPERQDPYNQTHPLTRDRIRAVDLAVASMKPLPSEDHQEANYWFDRSKAKLSAYLRPPSYTFSRLKASDTSDAAQIARAVAYFRDSDMTNARQAIGVVIERRPDDAYAEELLGWMEIESANPGAAVTAYEKAAALAPTESLILAGYGRALLAQNTAASNAQAIEVLERARARDRYDAAMLRDLAIAYARAGDQGNASLATAERYALAGRLEDADIHAQRAAGQLPVGSPGWERAQDIIRAAAAEKRRR
ncbi:MAG: M48 family metalloprotease [Rhodobacteraceae bacterium]|nr:M48 family metalloprotease [Paracoccaceae bacterium]